MPVSPIIETWLVQGYSLREREKSFKCGLPIGEEHYTSKPLRYKTLVPYSKKSRRKKDSYSNNKEKGETENEQSFHVII